MKVGGSCCAVCCPQHGGASRFHSKFTEALFTRARCGRSLTDHQQINGENVTYQNNSGTERMRHWHMLQHGWAPNATVGERSQNQKATHSMTCPEQENSETVSRPVVARSYDGGWLIGRQWVWHISLKWRCLDPDRGNSCTILQMYQVSLDCSLWMVNFMLYIWLSRF